MVTKLPPVSIGLPFFNAEPFLLASIMSIFAQTHQDWELILLDDGSTDRSLEIAHSITDPRVRVYSDGKNKKLAARLNEIHSLAKHDFIARMDADDLMATNRIEKQLMLMQTDPEVDLVTTGVCSITDEFVPYGIRVTAKDHVLTPYRVLSGQHGIVHAAVLGRRGWFMRNPYDSSDHWGEDYRLWVRASQKGDLSVAFIGEPLYYYREEGSATVGKMLSGQRMCREVIQDKGPGMIGRARTGALFGKSMLKSFVIGLAAAAGSAKYIARLRSPDIDKNYFQLVEADIMQIMAMNIPVSTCAD